MKFRKRLFSVLAVLVFLGGVVWALEYDEDVQEVAVENEVEAAARDVGEGIGMGIIFCVTAPLVGLFALLAWRNAVGIRTEERHREHMDVMRQRRD